MGTPRAERAVRATEKAVRGIVQEGVDGNIPGMQDQLRQRIDYEVKRAAGETVFQNAVRDGRYVRFARVPSGIGETCDFCIMLASRGFVYHTEATAGELSHYHANCRCRIVPGFQGEMTVEGYDPDVYYRLWKGEELSKNVEIGEGRGDFTTISLNPSSKLFDIEDDEELRKAIEESLRCETTDGFNKLPHEIKQYLAADMEAFFEDYPQLLGNISKLGISYGMEDGDAMQAQPIDTSGKLAITVNPNLFSSTEEVGSRYAGGGSHQIDSSSWPSLAYHEMAHAIEAELLSRRYNSSASEFYSEWYIGGAAREMVEKAWEQVESSYSESDPLLAAGHISGYAQSSPSELLCEAIKDVKINGIEAQALSLAIVNAVREVL